jgi:hypothetical protein
MLKKYITDSVDYAYEFFGQAVYRNTRESLWDYCLDISKITNDKITNKSKTIILEFGVWKGESINYFGKKCPQAEIYGFDSFTGFVNTLFVFFSRTLKLFGLALFIFSGQNTW